jgi:hypothetical protein
LTVLSDRYRVARVVLERVLLVGALASLALAGCGGSSHKPSTGATSAAASTGSPAASAGIATHLLTSNELHGFATAKPSVDNTISGWLGGRQTPSEQVASETKRLARLGFVAGASEDLTGHPNGGQGVSIAEQFKTAAGARSELANTLKVFKAQAGGPQQFAVAGIPGALGLASTKSGGVNVAFASGDYYYLVGAFLSVANASSEATMTAAAKHLYRRTHA